MIDTIYLRDVLLSLPTHYLKAPGIVPRPLKGGLLFYTLLLDGVRYRVYSESAVITAQETIGTDLFLLPRGRIVALAKNNALLREWLEMAAEVIDLQPEPATEADEYEPDEGGCY